MNQEKGSPNAFIGLDDEARVFEALTTSVFGLWQVDAVAFLRAHHSAWKQQAQAGGRQV